MINTTRPDWSTCCPAAVLSKTVCVTKRMWSMWQRRADKGWSKVPRTNDSHSWQWPDHGHSLVFGYRAVQTFLSSQNISTALQKVCITRYHFGNVIGRRVRSFQTDKCIRYQNDSFWALFWAWYRLFIRYRLYPLGLLWQGEQPLHHNKDFNQHKMSIYFQSGIF